MSKAVRVKVPQRATAALTWLAEMSPGEFDAVSSVLSNARTAERDLPSGIEEAVTDSPTGCGDELLTELLRLVGLRFSQGWPADEIAKAASRSSMLQLSEAQRAVLQDRLAEAMSKARIVRLARRHHSGNRPQTHVGTAAGKAVAAAIVLLAGAVAILAYVGWNPFKSAKAAPVAPASVLSRLLAETDKYRTPALVVSTVTHLRQQCESESIHAPAPDAAKCWLLLSSFYLSSARFRTAIAAMEMAEELDTRIADTYDNLGILYYDLLIFDLIEAKRYTIVSLQHLLVDVRPDGDSKVLARLSEQQFRQGQSLSFLASSVPPANVVVTSQQDIAQTQDQLEAIENGASVLPLTVNNVPAFLDLLVDVSPHDASVIHVFVTMTGVLDKYIKEHPDEFPGVPAG
jgi:hypothetical protein